jgi:hypothetical protein
MAVVSIELTIGLRLATNYDSYYGANDGSYRPSNGGSKCGSTNESNGFGSFSARGGSTWEHCFTVIATEHPVSIIRRDVIKITTAQAAQVHNS